MSRERRVCFSLCGFASLCFSASVSVSALGADVAERSVFKTDFDGEQSLEAGGWHVQADDGQSQWRVRDGYLEVVCHRSPYKGGQIVRPIPVLRQGTLEFDVKFAVSGGSNYDHLCLGFRLYGQQTAFKKIRGHTWMGYDPKRKEHWDITNDVPRGQWVHLRAAFDVDRKRMVFYMGDAPDPLYVYDRFAPDLSEDKRQLEFFNYGLCSGTITHLVDNIALRQGVPWGDGAATERDRLILFEGPSADRYRIADCLEPAFGKDRMSTYQVLSRGAAIFPRNQFALDRVPGPDRLRQAASIVLVDVPVGPGDWFPRRVLEELHEAVRSGAVLSVFGGMFALGKGAYQGTPLEELLPVRLEGKWRVKRFAQPEPIRAASANWTAGPAQGEPAVLWYHDVELIDADTTVVFRAGGKPLFVTRPYGRGQVNVFLGAAMGDFFTSSARDAASGGRQPADGSGGSRPRLAESSARSESNATPFWLWDGWPGWVRRMVQMAASKNEEK